METVNEEGQTAIKKMVFGQTQHLISQLIATYLKVWLEDAVQLNY
jgi:hypothetical protein